MSRAGLGYDLERLRAALVGVGGDASAAVPRFQALHVLASCRSTNEEARALVAEGHGPGCVVVADAQTAGRGRLGRAWHSPPGTGLYASLVVALMGETPRLSLLPLLAGVAVAEAVDALGAPDVELRWPNDVLVEGRKIAGVLCEHVAPSAESATVVVGLGVNVHHLLADFPPELRDQATSLRLALADPVPREQVLAAILARFHGLLAAAPSLEPFPWTRWRRFFHAEGTTVRASLSAEERIEGRVARVATDGALVLELADGSERRVVAGDVTPIT